MSDWPKIIDRHEGSSLHVRSFDVGAIDWDELWREPPREVRTLWVEHWRAAKSTVDDFAPWLAAAAVWPLASLTLGGYGARSRDATLGPVAPHLARYPALTALALVGTGADLAPLVHATLRELELWTALPSAAWVTSIQRMELPALTHLKLDLEDEQLGPVLAAALTCPSPIIYLRVRGVVDDTFFAVLEAGPTVPLGELDLRWCWLGEDIDGLAERMSSLPGHYRIRLDAPALDEAGEDQEALLRASPRIVIG